MYGKQFESMYSGSMIGAGALVFAVWGYVIAHRHKELVELNTELVAFVLGETQEGVSRAIERLCSPDPKSRTKVDEGRRLVREGEYLYRVVNARKFDEAASEYDRRERDKLRKRAERDTNPKESDEQLSDDEYERQLSDKAKAKSYHADARTVLRVFNEFSGKRFREINSNLALISQRLNEDGVDLAGVKLMIARQCKRWKGTSQAEYLRPETLFGNKKFDSYYAARGEPIYEEGKSHGAKKEEEDDSDEAKLRAALG